MTEMPGEVAYELRVWAEGELTVHPGDAEYDPADDPKNATTKETP